MIDKWGNPYVYDALLFLPSLLSPIIEPEPTRPHSSINSLLIRADEIIHHRPIRNRKLWINRQRPERQRIKRFVAEMERISAGESA